MRLSRQRAPAEPLWFQSWAPLEFLPNVSTVPWSGELPEVRDRAFGGTPCQAGAPSFVFAFLRCTVYSPSYRYQMEGYLFWDVFLPFFSIFFSLLASWLLGFLTSWLFGFLASWLFGFSASGLFGFLALAFRILCIPSSSSSSGILAFAAFGGFSFLHPLLPSSCPGFLAFAPYHWFLDVAFRIISITSSSLFESSLLRTSWGGSPPRNPPATV